MIVIPPVYSEEVQFPENYAIPAAPSSIQRIYGENIADAIYSDISTSQYREIVAKFTENGSRYIFDERSATTGSNLAARLYLIQELQSVSNDRI